MAEGGTLRIDKLHVPGGVIVRVAGELDATLEAGALVGELAGLVVMDLDGVKRVTSFGVREWIAAMGAMHADACCFLNARPPVVAQLNMVSGFAGRGTLLSFYLPYACDACDAETEVLVDLRSPEGRRMLATGAPPAVVACHACGAEAELDDAPEAYLAFAVTQGAVSLPPALDALVDRATGKSTSSAAPFRAQKEVTGRLTALWLQGEVGERARLRRLADGLEGTVVVVLAGVTGVDDRGAARLRQLSDATDAPVFWARVPLDVVAQAGARLRDVLRDRLVSVLVETACERCGATATVEIDGAVARGAAAAPSCRRCAAPAGDGLVALAAGARDLFADEVPATLTTYLDEHGGNALPEVGTVEVSKSVPAAPATGTVLRSRYEVVRPLGRGGMAEVFVAKQRGPQGFVKQVALKRILPELAENEHFSRLLLQEARVAAAITHPNVVQIFDFGQEDDAYFIAMELVAGWDLRTVVGAAQQAERPLPVELACRIAADICAGLHAAHTCVDDEGNELGIVHRDVSPHNVLLSSDGVVKLTDFGVSKVADSLVETRAGNLKGKVVYMSPEQIDGARGEVDARTDIWAVGAVLYEMLTGAPLFRRESEYMSMFAVLNEDIASARARRADVPEALDAVIARCLSREPAGRYASARAVQLALEEILADMARPATDAHLAEWLRDLAERSFETGAMQPFVTPTSSTASIDGGVTLRGALHHHVSKQKKPG